mmetsp:Transcript_103941/g.333217  ORF Transcript_103941/g.333217 Transcript_103941/m.333217 type:complete len:205 (+) Transcript_103941:9-623(+)
MCAELQHNIKRPGTSPGVGARRSCRESTCLLSPTWHVLAQKVSTVEPILPARYVPRRRHTACTVHSPGHRRERGRGNRQQSRRRSGGKQEKARRAACCNKGIRHKLQRHLRHPEMSTLHQPHCRVRWPVSHNPPGPAPLQKACPCTFPAASKPLGEPPSNRRLAARKKKNWPSPAPHTAPCGVVLWQLSAHMPSAGRVFAAGQV